jgi:enamine deaminase RidA (YjgF/YER057c/UK114 family)
MTYTKSVSGIQRYGTTQRWSDAVVFNRVAYLCEVPSGVEGDIAAQTHEVLGFLKSRLEEVGSSLEHILNATIYIPHPEDLPGFNAIWDAWIPQGTAPVRACIHAALTNPKMRVEVTLQAAVADLA